MSCDREEWAKVLFSDEKKWNLDGSDGYQYFWADKRVPEDYYSKRQQGGGSLMVWGGISANGKLSLIIMKGRFNADRYVQMLDDVNLHVEGVRICGENFILQQDNALIQCAKTSKNYLHAMRIQVLERPAKSPDLNPIENTWGWLTKEVYKNGKQYNTTDDLMATVLKAWEELPLKYLENLISSMPDRIYEVIIKKGGTSHYCWILLFRFYCIFRFTEVFN